MCKMPDHIKRSLNMILMLDKKVSSRLHSYLEAASKRSVQSTGSENIR